MICICVFTRRQTLFKINGFILCYTVKNAVSPELQILTQKKNKESYELADMQDCTVYNILLSRLHLGIGSTRTRATEPEGCEKGTI